MEVAKWCDFIPLHNLSTAETLLNISGSELGIRVAVEFQFHQVYGRQTCA
jgi:mRNA-degrading endonuclease HigB of HigAB toxin-antitoxin module